MVDAKSVNRTGGGLRVAASGKGAIGPGLGRYRRANATKCDAFFWPPAAILRPRDSGSSGLRLDENISQAISLMVTGRAAMR